MAAPQPIEVLFVCLGNHCRSPAAHAVAIAHAEARGLQHIAFDSAATSRQHVGQAPHPLAVVEGAVRAYAIDHRARQLHPDDFERFDLIVAMDRNNVDDLERLRGGIDHRRGFYRTVEPHQIQLLRRWDPYAMPGDEDVDDPWNLGPQAYAAMFDTIERCVPPLLDHLSALVAESAI